jgi:hypothetical protein
MFGSLGLPELLIVVVTAILLVAPIWRILRRTGLPPLIALAAFIPPLGFIVLWYIAFARWPRAEQNP